MFLSMLQLQPQTEATLGATQQVNHFNLDTTLTAALPHRYEQQLNTTTQNNTVSSS